MKTRTACPAIIFGLLFVLHAACMSAEVVRPNFVIVMVDDMGYGDAGCYGSLSIPTPNIDGLADGGMKFTDFHSSGAVCSPTRAGLLTGRYQQRAGVDGVIYAAFNRNRHHGLQLQEVTFAERLRDNGYATAMFGKWHLGYEEQYNPVHQGFDRFVGYVSGNVDFHTHIDGAGVFDWWHQNQHHRESGYTTHLITAHAVQFIRQHKDQPFCIYVAHEAPHDPYQGPDDPPVRREGQGPLIYDHREPTHAVRAYREMMVEMDKGIGQLVETIRELNLASNTLVLFFSDNGATGPGSCGALYGMKGTLWEGGHRVPGIAWWPERIRAGTTSSQLACTIDVMPTLLELSGIPPSPDRSLDGISLVPALSGQVSHANRKLFWQYNQAICMRNGDWKLVINGGKRRRRSERFPNINWDRPDDGRDKLALFDLSNDIGEHHNLVDKFPDRVSQMQTAIKEWQHEVMVGATVQPRRE